MKLEGNRKFYLAVLGIVSYTTIMITQTVDPFNLGLGLGLMLSPSMMANAFEHKYNAK